MPRLGLLCRRTSYVDEWPDTDQETTTIMDQVGTPMRTYGLRFDVNCSILFTELPLLARPAAARAAGFDLVSLNFHTGEGALVLVEAINSVDAPAFPIDSSAAAMAVIDKVPAANVAFLADLYHLARMGEDLATTLTACRDRIGHVQIADSPGRGAPGTGTLDFEPLFAQLAAQGYAGRVGLEYLPLDPSDSSTSFSWL